MTDFSFDCVCRWNAVGGGNAPIINIPTWWLGGDTQNGNAPSIDIPEVREIVEFPLESKR